MIELELNEKQWQTGSMRKTDSANASKKRGERRGGTEVDITEYKLHN